MRKAEPYATSGASREAYGTLSMRKAEPYATGWSRALSDSQIVDALQRGAAPAADDGGTIPADQGINHGRIASRTVKLHLRFRTFTWHYCYTNKQKPPCS
jgi:hypothetical protein